MRDFIKKRLKEEMEKKILYSAVVLDRESRVILSNKIGDFIPDGWQPFMHHMTIAFGKALESLNLGSDEGREITLKVTHFGKSDMAMAVKVEGYITLNDIPHVTVATNIIMGGKPHMSNKIQDWEEIEPFTITGIVSNVYSQ